MQRRENRRSLRRSKEEKRKRREERRQDNHEVENMCHHLNVIVRIVRIFDRAAEQEVAAVADGPKTAEVMIVVISSVVRRTVVTASTHPSPVVKIRRHHRRHRRRLQESGVRVDDGRVIVSNNMSFIFLNMYVCVLFKNKDSYIYSLNNDSNSLSRIQRRTRQWGIRSSRTAINLNL